MPFIHIKSLPFTKSFDIAAVPDNVGRDFGKKTSDTGGTSRDNSQTQMFFLPQDRGPGFKTGRRAKIDGWS
jgi:hypothetical protein